MEIDAGGAGFSREAARGQGWQSVAASPARNVHFCFFLC